MDLRGSCKKCQAPVFLNRTTDWFGNNVVTLSCWNGHYRWINIEGVEEAVFVDPNLNVVDHIGFFDLA
jgi:hypothetical protein